MTKSELVEVLIKNFTDKEGNLNLSNLNLSEVKGKIMLDGLIAHGDIDFSEAITFGNIKQDNQNADGVITQHSQSASSVIGISSYELMNGKEGYVEKIDGILSKVVQIKKYKFIKIKRATDIKDNTEISFIAQTMGTSAHGETVKEAISSLRYKIENIKRNKQHIADRIVKAGKITREDYRELTGACSYGIGEFCEKHKINAETKSITIDELKGMLNEEDYGYRTFQLLIVEHEKLNKVEKELEE